MSHFHLHLLGGFSAKKGTTELAGCAKRKAEALLCFLAVTSSPQSRSMLAGLLWRDRTEDNARSNLRQVLTNLRKVYGSLIQSNRNEVWLDPDRYELDVAKISQAGSIKDLAELQAIADLYQGDFLAGFVVRNAPAFEEWILIQQTRLREEAIYLLGSLRDHCKETGELDAGISAARRLLEIDAWHEEGHRQLMALLAEHGQRSAALAQYEKCKQLLREEFAVEPSPETEALIKQIREGEGFRPKIKSISPPPQQPVRQNLPTQATPFVGRTQEVTEIRQLISQKEIQLVTIAAQGGMGKSRLAIAVGNELLDGEQFPHGIFFVALASLHPASEIVVALAQAIHFQLQKADTRSPKRQILDYLRTKKMLLIFDNFEHLLDGTELILEILNVAPAIKILATSRERLNLTQETVYTLGGLKVDITIDQTSKLPSEAGQLFVQSARKVNALYTIEEEEETILNQLLDQLDGMPLAIELAAGWIDTLSLSDIVHELQQSMDILETSARNIPERHRSMRAMWKTIWQHLSVEDRETFPKLTVFHNGFTREAAQKIADISLPQLQKLINKSIIYFDRHTERYDLHPLLSQLGFEALSAEQQALDTSTRKHMRFYCQHLQNLSAGIKTSKQRESLICLERDIDNILAAWAKACTENEIDLLATIIEPLHLAFSYLPSSTVSAAEDIFAYALSVVASPTSETTHLIVRLQAILFYLHWATPGSIPKTKMQAYQQDILDCYTQLERSAPAFSSQYPHVMYYLGICDFWVFEERKRGYQLVSNCLEFLDAAIQPFDWARAYTTLARMQGMMQSNQDEVRTMFYDSLEVRSNIGDLKGEAEILIELAAKSWYQSQFEEAEELVARASAIFAIFDDHITCADCNSHLGWINLLNGTPAAALKNFETDLHFYQNLGSDLSWIFFGISMAMVDLGEYDAAIEYGEISQAQAQDELFSDNEAYAWSQLARVNLIRNQPLLTEIQSNRAIELLRNISQPDEIAYSLALSAMARVTLGELSKAKNDLVEALEIVLVSRSFKITLVLSGVALLYVAQGCILEAVRIYAVASQHPYVGGSKWFADVAGKPILRAATALPTSDVQSAQQQGREADMWEVAESLRQEFLP